MIEIRFLSFLKKLFWPCWVAFGVDLWPGIEPVPLQLKHRVLTTGPPGKSLDFIVYLFKLCLNPCGVSIIIKPTGTSYRERQWGHRPWISQRRNSVSSCPSWIFGYCVCAMPEMGMGRDPRLAHPGDLGVHAPRALRTKEQGTSTLRSKLGCWV